MSTGRPPGACRRRPSPARPARGRVPARGTAAVLAAAVLAGVLVAAGAGVPWPGPPAGATGSPAGAVPAAAPLATTWATSQGSWAVVAMGRLHQYRNTFWQLFSRSAGSGAWTLATPEGVADNGGLVAGTGTAGAVTAGFEPSQYLTYSPVARSTDGGRQWSPGLLPGALLAVPDALAAGERTGVLALVRSDGGSLLASTGSLSGWRRVADRGSLAATAPGRRCGLVGLRAVAVSGATDVLGAACASAGVVGILDRAGGAWRLAGPALPGAAAHQPTAVLRLQAGPEGTSALVQAGRGPAAELFAAWRSGPGAPWSLSPVLRPRGSLAATGFGPAGQVVVTGRAGQRSAAETVAGPGQAWVALPALPRGTAALAAGPGRTVDALAVDGKWLTDWQLSPSGRWAVRQRLAVPIVYGSST